MTNEKYVQIMTGVDSQMDIGYVSIASSEHFTYKAEGKRPWGATTVLELLEQTHQEFEKLMGPSLETIIQVEDRIGEPNNYSTRAEIKKQVGSVEEFTIEVRIICEFPIRYGHTEEEMDTAYHFFVHELFHCWIGGAVANLHQPIIEALTQYMTNWALVKLGWCSKDLLIRERTNWQHTLETANLPHTLIAGYKLHFDQIHTNAPEYLFAFCRDLAACFRDQQGYEEIDVSYVLMRYLGTKK